LAGGRAFGGGAPSGLGSAAGTITLSLVSGGTAVRNRSATVTVQTPRGPVEVVRQEMRGLRQRSSWTTFWLARRKGRNDWAQADTAREAIRRATLLAPRKPPPWLAEAAADAERMIDDQAVPDRDPGEGSSGESSNEESARS
jgi:hypothetical protein